MMNEQEVRSLLKELREISVEHPTDYQIAAQVSILEEVLNVS